MITQQAIVTPVYINASADFGRWFSHNWRALEHYYKQLGGDKYFAQEYIAFCRCQFDRQSISESDVKLVIEANEQTVRNLAMLRSA